MNIGRFAPSPTGPLHMGSLLTALASYLDIKSRAERAQWYVRIDDLDPPRQDPDAVPAILAALHAHGLTGDRPVDYASTHQHRYQQAFEQLAAEHFYCRCTRKQLTPGQAYPGTCRANTQPLPNAAVRLRARSGTLTIDDALLGPHTFDMQADCGDLIIRRRDGLWAYNFATAVDDGHDVSQVLRGQDLWPVTANQVYIMRALDLAAPTYTHIPLLCYADGTKLSKQNHAPPIEPAAAPQNLRYALRLLGQNPPPATDWPVSRWLRWGLTNWDAKRIPGRLPPFGT